MFPTLTPTVPGLAFALAVSLFLDPRASAQGGGAPVRVFGFEPVAVGGATLAKQTLPDGSHVLQVSNLGSSGLDGVSFALDDDEADGWCSFETEIAGDGDESITWETFGALDGGASGSLGTLSFEHVLDPVHGTRWHLSSDNAALGGGGAYTLRLWDDGYVVHEQSGLTERDEIILETGPRVIYWVENLGGDDDDDIYWCSVFSDGITVYGISGPGGGGGDELQLQASFVQIVPEGTDTLGSCDLTAAQGTFADTGDVTLTGMCSKILGQWVSGNDEAQLENKGGKIKISNLGSSGCDGFSVSGGGDGGGGPGTQTAELSVDLDALGGGGVVSPGAVFDLRVDAIVQGELHEDFASITLTKGAAGAPDGLEFGCDPKMVTVTWFYEYCLAGAVVDTGSMAGQVFGVDGGWDVDLRGAAFTDPAGGEVLAVAFDAATTAYVDGAAFAVDEIRLRLDLADAIFVSDKASLSVEVGGIPELLGAALASSPTPFVSQGHCNTSRHVTLIKAPLSGGGPMGPDTLNALMLGDMPASSIAGLFLGFEANPTAFKKGLLVPVPVAELFILATGPEGTLDIPFQWPAGIPPGLSTYAQYAVQDAGPPAEVRLSNALELISR